MRHTTLKQLRSLAAVIRTGTVTAASNEMNVTPPAITAQVKALEDLVGIPLIERVGDRFKPTAAGEEIATTLARIEALLSECGDALAELKDAGSGKVAIGVVSTAKYFAPKAIAAFRRERPRVDIRLFVGNREELIHALKNYEIDLAIMGRPPREFEVEAKSIGDHPQVIIAAPDHPLADRDDEIDPTELANETFLVREDGSGTRTSFEAFMVDVFHQRPPHEIEMSSNETIKQAVMAGLGIAFISAHTIALEVEIGQLKILKVKGLPIRRQWFVVRRTEKRLLPAATALRDFWMNKGGSFLPKVPGL
ncbi:LysR family transcriptional regulator [Chthonobacter albigriseus]|uniref:LysR family transcriptional regulator n=1 Tax=Chthonobacter albigriseus TaxID=1683161 RepID=UPI0015EF6086|nr:LysR family transcriptional regulator [Chthonobacter albigriseus]